MLSSAYALVLAVGLVTAGTIPGRRGPVLEARDGSLPSLPYDPNTTSSCTWWADIRSATTCDDIISENFISLAKLTQWNPSISATSCSVEIGKSYCVEAPYVEPAPGTSISSTKAATSPMSSTATSSSSASTTVVPPVTTTAPGNGITTPTPTQASIVDNCDAFHFVTAGQTCEVIASLYGISQDQFKEWNPSVGASCTGLWANAYACVSIIGHTPTKPTTTTTTTGNGIATPTPTQASIVNNCDAFYFVVAGDTCEAIAAKNGITQAQFLSWNPSVGSTCNGLWANAYACVSIVGHTPTKPTTTTTTTTTSVGNGIATPTPVQPNMVKNCDLFYKVKSGDTCATIAAAKGVTVAQLTTWNPYVKSDCSLLWVDYNICISIVGHTPTPVKPGNGIQTPTPIQSGMTTSCRTFHFVTSGQTCQTIIAKYGITQANFVKWNPAVKSDCTGMWANAYVCVAVL
ncbi:hypothetical protein SMACR_09599 [Sordaria macrospora]|uniref:WGS project CABT00000000 data, contig 2.126 n=2 Tax=Sordaria macrospora TaxID=5147 RepID=F7WCF2_SORMK|nr:uncharacterized protein SMAC_09599 [Sordaria macrospora k-hell]KAA8622132.1 hypothetical protein SMACR_09599 [Sordaria macrospora]WPJ62720.1 hypothetical protein SMAC4_13586 [Sordaria macrospora]WPJ66369.1 hypothetical protein SMAC4_09599 [Sordaria macrospora]CCC05607.1 unnamed protein product [Sordaria macrospora k-hell]